jgi:hypothetical protein
LGYLFPALLIMSVPSLISFVVVYKLVKARQAQHWPSTPGVITKSQTRAVQQSHSRQTDTVKTVPCVEYRFKVGGFQYEGTQIRAGDKLGSVPDPEILDRFPKDATVLVYYNPASPQECALETHLPYSAAKAWAFAAVVFMAGIGAALAFTNLDTVMETLDSHFPAGAVPQGVIFFGLCSLWIVYMILDNRRQAGRAKGWPTAEGMVVSSKAGSFSTSSGGATRGTRVKLYEPVVEYSYQVKGRDYHSTQVSFGARVSTQSQEVAEQRAARYPQGSRVVVHYDPQHASIAVLETTVAFQPMMIVLAIVFLGLTLFFSGVRP